jgi:transcriptional regulator with XRE-family HTH domain
MANQQSRSDNVIQSIIKRSNVTANELAQYLGTSLVTVIRWARGDICPTEDMQKRLTEIMAYIEAGGVMNVKEATTSHVFASRGARRVLPAENTINPIERTNRAGPPIPSRLNKTSLWGNGETCLASILTDRDHAAVTLNKAVVGGVSAGKNTYTYDAHTYHTKVPPQGIAEVISHYLPEGGLVLDPFAGSGMTGVAALTTGNDVVLNELSPAASFIADRFTHTCDPSSFASAVKAVCDSLGKLRKSLYTTKCRTCARDTEILYTIWSYYVCCTNCTHEFLLWDHCREYGKSVKEHKILSEFHCPSCKSLIKKSRLKRTRTEPVLIGYKCCSRYQVEHPLTMEDRARLTSIEESPVIAEGFTPEVDLPEGVNLSQPKRHGLTTVKSFYTARNLSAMSHLWKEIHKIKDPQLAGFIAFAFTSLYQRVTKLSEYRFWGGSGNTAHFNVPYIFNEANVFLTFERKARSIQDHLETTSLSYKGRCVVHTGSATDLKFFA